MMSRYYLIVSAGLLIVSLLAAACGASPDVSPPEGAPSGGEIIGYASLVDALRAAGATVEPGESVEQPFFEPTGQVINVNGESVQVFEFESVEAREEASATISPDGSSVGTSMVSWIDQPNFWAMGQIVVLYVSSGQSTIDLLTSVLGEPLTEHTGT
jgi:hypothetical protein